MKATVTESTSGVPDTVRKSQPTDGWLEAQSLRKAVVSKLGPLECVSAVLFFALWLIIFVGGIAVDTTPSRCTISPVAVAALEGKKIDEVCKTLEPNRLKAWAILLFWFTPVNLALVSASAGLLGSFGDLANLDEDRKQKHPRDSSNPYIGSILRGFFVYLFLISGLLLIDLNPFANPTPGQYIRLAGLLSILSFVINYRPRLFRMLTQLAVQRIQERDKADDAENAGKVKYRRHLEVNEEQTAIVPADIRHRTPKPE